MASIPRIGIDAMGGDFGPSEVAEGTVLALREMPGRFPMAVECPPERIERARKASPAAQKGSGPMTCQTCNGYGQVRFQQFAAMLRDAELTPQ